MTDQERRRLAAFLQQLIDAKTVRKDSEADTLVRDACARQSDAAYLLVERAMLLEQALANSRDEITRLQGQLDLTGNRSLVAESGAVDANAWGNTPARPSPPAPRTALGSEVTGPSHVPASSAWGSGMLGTMATTAAGVVAGGFLFQGIGQLLGGAANRGTPDASNSEAASPAIEHALGGNAGDKAAGEADSNSVDRGIFDTRSLDDYIASDVDSGDEGI